MMYHMIVISFLIYILIGASFLANMTIDGTFQKSLEAALKENPENKATYENKVFMTFFCLFLILMWPRALIKVR